MRKISSTIFALLLLIAVSVNANADSDEFLRDLQNLSDGMGELGNILYGGQKLGRIISGTDRAYNHAVVNEDMCLNNIRNFANAATNQQAQRYLNSGGFNAAPVNNITNAGNLSYLLGGACGNATSSGTQGVSNFGYRANPWGFGTQEPEYTNSRPVTVNPKVIRVNTHQSVRMYGGNGTSRSSTSNSNYRSGSSGLAPASVISNW